MATLLITGANRGLGLEFVRQYLADGWQVHATARAPDQAEELIALANDRLTLHALDVSDPAAIAALAATLDGAALDLVIAGAGVMGDPGPIGQFDPQDWVEVFKVNTIAPVLLAAALRENLKAGTQRKLVAITSRMGSIGDGPGGAVTPYRTTKAALNMGWVNMAAEFRADGIIATLLHPGWVRTRMGGPNALISPEDSVTGMRAVIDRLTPADSGRFFDYTGKTVPW